MKNKLFWFIAFGSWLILACIFLYSIISGNIPFWYDPARDMLSAWDNLHKLTLIGSTSGIPGIFYGPYWIWFLSIPVFFSKDPRFVTLITSFIPYMFFLPLILFLFKKYFNKYILLTLWILFILSAKPYVLFIWNPYISPLLFLLATYLILSAVRKEKFFSCLKLLFLAGMVSGLALNINIAFGAVFGLSSVLFLLLNASFRLKLGLKIKIRQFFLQVSAFLIGVALMFSPFFLFEIRHGFEQTKTALTALSHGGGGIVAINGLTKPQIVESFFMRWGHLLQVPSNLSMVILVVLSVVLILLFLKKKVNFSEGERGMLLFILSIAIGCLGLFLSVHNPVWDYHFIGIEILWILLLGIFLTKIPFIKYVAYAWVIFLLVMTVVGFWGAIKTPILTTNSLATKEYIVKAIANDAKKETYGVYTYSASIYVYEYAYLFRWLANKDVPYDPGTVKLEKEVYLILPADPKTNPTLGDFVSYRTPVKLYKTVKTLSIPDGTVILKRTLF